MPSLADTFREINVLKDQRVIREYAVGGAMAMVFWAEPTLTFDLDVFIVIDAGSGPVISLAPIYDRLRERGCAVVAEHVVIHGTPVQFLVSPNALCDEAIDHAAVRDYEGVSFRVMTPEYLCALWLQLGGAKRSERVEVFRQSGVIDEAKLQALLDRYSISK